MGIFLNVCNVIKTLAVEKYTAKEQQNYLHKALILSYFSSFDVHISVFGRIIFVIALFAQAYILLST